MASTLPAYDPVYPDSDGKPLADNTRQYEWIVTIKGNLDAILPGDFVAGDLLWYPVRGAPKIRIAPDVLVALGRPKGHRRSYRQWEEDGVAPQVVFEIMSPSNDWKEMLDKGLFYREHGVEEFYLYDPDDNDIAGFLFNDHGRTPIASFAGWVSPRLGIRFEPGAEALTLLAPDGAPFRTFAELTAGLARAEEALASERARADQERARADALAAKLRALGAEP